MTKLRLRDLEPEEVARSAFETVAADAARRARAISSQLSPPKRAERSPVYRLVLRIGRYAVRGECADNWTVGSDVEPLCGVFSSLQLMQPEPHTPLAMVVAGAYAREKLDGGEPLTMPDVHVLTGLHRDHLNRLANDGTIPGAYRSDESGHRPWMFRPSAKLRAWLLSYSTPAAQDTSHGNASP